MLGRPGPAERHEENYWEKGRGPWALRGINSSSPAPGKDWRVNWTDREGIVLQESDGDRRGQPVAGPVCFALAVHVHCILHVPVSTPNSSDTVKNLLSQDHTHTHTE